LAAVREWARGTPNALQNRRNEAEALLECVESLFLTMDSGLQFHPAKENADRQREQDSPQAMPPVPRAEAPQATVGVETKLDLKGVACPLNFVHAKLKMETLSAGAVLALVLDDGEPVRNVPESFRAEGYDVIEQTDLCDGHWRVKIRNKP